MIRKVVLFLIAGLWGVGVSFSADLQKLRLGYQGFILGKSPTSLEGFLPDREAFPGTLRYRKGHLVVVLEEKERQVLALYEEFPRLSPEELRKRVGYLFGLFGEPTFEAHGRMLFWYFTPQGKLSAEEFRKLREEGRSPEVLAIGKFYCDHRIMEFGKGAKKKEKARAYFTLYAPEPLRRIVKNQ
ncbi:hypothetical protein FVE67_02220 [Thermosulfurimonas marina]|uniref:Uncharacterized protein n=1 Tax=Thermosulfurimonas marina TaxID=2047767 RepID=A0A6H1WRC1_9BACT|nr:hypothetical protein [Thermosulfurimonas marina]QJA05686.1 hypothetical protein FVE67_02220 [Thermosulfurimonas marina]